VSPDPTMDFSVSLGITPKEYAPEQILNLAEIIAQKQGKRIVVCIDEFQQIGEFPDSVTVQKRLRGAWQLQQNASYCLFGSKKHLMTNMFQNKSMPFFQFGDVASGVHDGFLSKKVMDEFQLGTKSNISKVKKILIDRDLVEVRETGLFISDPVFQMWFRRTCL